MGESKCQTNPALNRAGKLQGARFCHRLPVAVGTQNDGEPLFNTSEPRSKKKKKQAGKLGVAKSATRDLNTLPLPTPGRPKSNPHPPEQKLPSLPSASPRPTEEAPLGGSGRREAAAGGGASPVEAGGAPWKPGEPRGGRRSPAEAGVGRRRPAGGAVALRSAAPALTCSRDPPGRSGG